MPRAHVARVGARGPKTRVVVIGGGMAGLTAASCLTETPELRRRFDVSVYQLGWRLGGKVASGRNTAVHDRNEEHGLHVLFGCYENTFGLIAQTWAERPAMAGSPFPTWQDAFRRQDFAVFGDLPDGPGRRHWRLPWPRNSDALPSGALVTPWGAVTHLFGIATWAVQVLADAVRKQGGALPPSPEGMPSWLTTRLAQTVRWLSDPKLVLGHAQGWLSVASALAQSLTDPAQSKDEQDAAGLLLLAAKARALLRNAAADEIRKDTYLRRVWVLADLTLAFVRGMLNPAYGIYRDWDLSRIDHLEFSDWLAKNGAHRDALDAGLVRGIYHTVFSFGGQGQDERDIAAGAGIRFVLRIIGTYKGSVLYLPRAGMGELVVAPVYEVLRQRGVKFHFFRKLSNVLPASDGRSVARFDFEVQAREKRPYEPLIAAGGLRCWPAAPLWDQLEDGDRMAKAAVDFESTWCRWPAAARESLSAGRDFDLSVLALPIGALKKLNGDPTPADALALHSERLRESLSKIGVAPSLAAQLWLSKDLAELGWRHARAAMVAGPPPLDIWADMSDVLATEAGVPARSLHYFCGTLHTDLHLRPSAHAGVAAEAQALAQRETDRWLVDHAQAIWPGACAGGAFDFSNLSGQFVRANVDRSSLCARATAKTITARLDCDASGFDNLFLAGAWHKTGLNMECLEAAVMSGMECARAVSGSPTRVVGEAFMQRR